MAGYFELVDAPDGGYRVRLLDGSGTLMAISVTFPTKKAAAAGVAKAREIAGTGLIRDLSRDQSQPLAQQPVRAHTKPAKKAMAGLGSGRLAGVTGQKRTHTHH
jgi:uncharacterized protein YegP (UPF0339 family)